MIRPYTLLRPDFMRGELARVPDFTPEIGAESCYRLNSSASVAPEFAVAV
jgi:hypothetical protein